MKEGIVLLGHGSRDPEWSQPFEKIAVSVGKRMPAVAVALAYLEHGPSLEEAVTALAAKGALSIRVVPLFLGTGGHVRDDLPKLVAQAKRADVNLMLEKPIGEQPEVIEAIASVISSR
ncbi:MAG: sirohydrochlorin cobaltochelatase [Betaproteobacteria bacterium]|nr:sirohydrochlorin cobaltochelatase [Betaproteobacteria bacterium]